MGPRRTGRPLHAGITGATDDDARRSADTAARSRGPGREDVARSAAGAMARAGITIGALVVYTWGLSKNGYGNPYYAAAVRSMTHSWKNFAFGAVDPGGWITTDKPPLALWLGSLSARIFGYSSWSLLMPSVLCGVASIWLLMSAVRRAWGGGPGAWPASCSR